MKKLLLIFVVAMLTGGMAWAMGTGDPSDIPDFDDIVDGIEFDGFAGRVNTNVVPMLSTEGRNTAGRFTGAADAFVNPRFHNPDLEGTFLFLGGDADMAGGGRNRVDLGFARNLGPAYLGVYFGGGFVNAAGVRFEESAVSQPDSAQRIDARARITDWDVSFATLIGIAGMGIRLDIGIENTEDPNVRASAESTLMDGVYWNRTSAPSFALTWGANMGQLLPWARIGFRATQSSGYTLDAEMGGPPRVESESVTTSQGALEIAGGARFLLSDTSAVGGELWFGTTFRDRVRSSTNAPGATGRYSESDDRFPGSLTGFGLTAYYQQRIEGDRAALGFRPVMNLGFSTSNRNMDFDPEATGYTSFEVIGQNAFSLNLGVDVGARWQATERITLLSGVNVRLFQWTTASQTGQNTSGTAPYPEAEYSAWLFTGSNISNFNIGMTFAASDNIVMGLGLNSLLNGLFGQRTDPNFAFTVTTVLGN